MNVVYTGHFAQYEIYTHALSDFPHNSERILNDLGENMCVCVGGATSRQGMARKGLKSQLQRRIHGHI